MAEESNDLQCFRSYRTTLKEPTNINTKGVEKCASDFDKLDVSVDNVRINELSLVDMNGEEGESFWLAEGISINEGMENEWLKGGMNLTGVTVEKNTLIDKLDNLARKSEANFERSPPSPSNDIHERSLISPPILPSDYLTSQPVSSTPAAKSPGSKVSKVKMSSPKLLDEADGNTTIITSDQLFNSTFDKESANSTFNREYSPPAIAGLNSTFSKDEVQNLNSTFSKEGNATFNQTGNMNATFDLSKEKNNCSVETPERIEEIKTDMVKESELKTKSSINCDEASKTSMTMDSLNNFKDRTSRSCPASPSSEHGSDNHARRLGGGSIRPQISRNRLPPPSRLQAPPHMRFQTPHRSKVPSPTQFIPRGTPVPPPTSLISRGTPAASASGKVRSGLRPPMSIPRNALKPPTAIPKTGLRLPAQVPGKTLRPPTIPQANLPKPLKSGSNLRPPISARPPASVVESGLRKPSGIVRPSALASLARPSGLARPTAGVRQGKNKQTASSDNEDQERTGSGTNSRLVTG